MPQNSTGISASTNLRVRRVEAHWQCARYLVAAGYPSGSFVEALEKLLEGALRFRPVSRWTEPTLPTAEPLSALPPWSSGGTSAQPSVLQIQSIGAARPKAATNTQEGELKGGRPA